MGVLQPASGWERSRQGRLFPFWSPRVAVAEGTRRGTPLGGACRNVSAERDPADRRNQCSIVGRYAAPVRPVWNRPHRSSLIHSGESE